MTTGIHPWTDQAVAPAPLTRSVASALAVADGVTMTGRWRHVEGEHAQPSDALVSVLRRTRRKDEATAMSDGVVKSVVVPRTIDLAVSLQRPPQPLGHIDSRARTWFEGLTRSLQLDPLPSGTIDSRFPELDLSNVKSSEALSVADGYVKSVVVSSTLDRNMHIIPTLAGIVDSRYWDGVTEILAPYWSGAPPVLNFLQGTGGSFNFAPFATDPQELPLAFSLVGTAYTGISISAAGLLTVTGAATAGTRAYAVRATNTGGKTADHLISIVITATGSVFIVYSNGVGGTHATIAAAIAAMAAGTTLELRNSVAGSTTVWAQAINFTGKVGNAANMYRLQVRDGDKVVIRTGGTLLNLTNCAYVELRGNSTGVTGLQIGDERDYVHTAAEWQNCYPHNYGLLAANSHHWKISNATLTGGRQYYSNDTGFDCADYELNNVRVCKTGTNCYNTNNTDARNICRIRGRRVRIIGCVADHGGHEPFEFCAASLVVRGGTFSGYWADLSPSPGSRCSSSAGNRNFNIGNGPQLIEGATIRDSGASGDQSEQVLMKNETNHLIMRGCYFLDSDSAIYLSAYTTQGESSPTTTPSMNYQCIYHCTAYNTKGTWYNNINNYQAGFGVKFYERNRVQNNLFMACADGDRSSPGGGQIFSYDSRNVLDGFANGFKGSLIKGNQLGGTSANWNVELKADGGTTGVYPITAPHASWTGNITGNRVSAVTFSDIDGAPHRSPAGFSVTNWGTGAAGDAPALATVTAATGNYDTNEWIALDTARAFFDGWGVTGEVGDYVVIGATATGGTTRQIAACDYVANRIRLTAATDVTNGHGVWFAGNPANGAASVWDNRGAAQ